MKKILYIHDLHFYCHGETYYTSSNMPDVYFDRFFDAADCEVSIFSRLIKLSCKSELPKGYHEIKNKRIKISNLSPSRYLDMFSPIKLWRLIIAFKEYDLLVANIPSILGMFGLLINDISKTPYSVEVAADYDQFASKKFGFLISYAMNPLMKYFIKKAKGATYVSNYLKKKYICKNKVIVSSNVNIDFVVKNKVININDGVNITFIGGLNKRKGLMTLFEAVKILKENYNDNFVVNIIGGHADRDWNYIAKELEISGNIIFHGLLSKLNILKILDESDIYIQPSITEGIPRATIEAMSRGLPVIATNLPGFIEILDNQNLVSVSSKVELADKMKEFISNEGLLKRLSEINIQRAEDFHYKFLHEIRCNYYKEIVEGL
ncbi:glycosyltransferase [Vibrio lentus]